MQCFIFFPRANTLQETQLSNYFEKRTPNVLEFGRIQRKLCTMGEKMEWFAWTLPQVAILVTTAISVQWYNKRHGFALFVRALPYFKPYYCAAHCHPQCLYVFEHPAAFSFLNRVLKRKEMPLFFLQLVFWLSLLFFFPLPFQVTKEHVGC